MRGWTRFSVKLTNSATHGIHDQQHLLTSATKPSIEISSTTSSPQPHKSHTMALSRAVLRSASTAFASLRISSTRTLASTAPSRARQLHHLSLSARPLLAQPTTLTTTLSRRYNSTDAATAETPSAVEAPDYLDEKELHIFQKLAQELQPTKLEVCENGLDRVEEQALTRVKHRFKMSVEVAEACTHWTLFLQSSRACR